MDHGVGTEKHVGGDAQKPGVGVVGEQAVVCGAAPERVAQLGAGMPSGLPRGSEFGLEAFGLRGHVEQLPGTLHDAGRDVDERRQALRQSRGGHRLLGTWSVRHIERLVVADQGAVDHPPEQRDLGAESDVDGPRRDARSSGDLGERGRDVPLFEEQLARGVEQCGLGARDPGGPQIDCGFGLDFMRHALHCNCNSAVRVQQCGEQCMIPTLDGVHHLKLPVSDLECSIDWYCSRLGYEVVVVFRHRGERVGVSMVHPDGGPMLGLVLAPDKARGAAGFDYFSIGVADRARLIELAEHLTSLGEQHAGVHFATVGWILPMLHDPDGHEVRFYSTESHTSMDPANPIVVDDAIVSAQAAERDWLAERGQPVVPDGSVRDAVVGSPL